MPGEAGEQSSYCSELGGLVGIVAFLNSLQLPSPLPSPNSSITILCDGQSSLDKTNVPLELVKAKYMYSDLISILSHLTTDSKFQFITEHVKANQDEHQGPLSVK